MEELINRAKSLLIYMTEEEAAKHLDALEIDRGDALLAIKAAAQLLRYENEEE